MTKTKNIILLCAGVVVIIVLIVVISKARRSRSGTKENFKILGALGPYSDTYYRCMSECEREDPAKRMTPARSSFGCQSYCDSVITDWSRRGGPSYPSDSPVEPPVFATPIDRSYEFCGDGVGASWCRELYSTASEIDEKCRQDCAYSTLPEITCMDLCSKSLVANNSRGWTWK